jgi:PAS domain S-box-containing protein
MAEKENLLISRETQRWLDILFEGIFIVDRKKNIVFWNKGAEKITGFEAREMTGKKYQELSVNHFDSNGTKPFNGSDYLDKALDGKSAETKLLAKHKKGYNVPISINISPFRNSNESIIGAIHIFRDVSAEEKLEQLEKKYRKVIHQYVSETTYKQIIKSINRENYQFSGRNRELTILFMDIVGFTSLSEKLEPEKVVDLLNAYFSLTSLIIQKNAGDIDKFLGDGVMAIFKEAENSIQAAIDMIQTGQKKLNLTLQSMELPEIDIRIGINSGKLVQGHIGSEERKDWTVVGDVVNTAYRIEESANPGSIRLSEFTLERLKNPENYLFVQEITLKGKSRPIKIYTPICLGRNSKFSENSK